MSEGQLRGEKGLQGEPANETSILEIERSSWRRVSAVLASTVTLLAALGPLTAWINGHQDRKLQEAKARDDISLRYMSLLLTRSETIDERRAVLGFLEGALSAKNPSALMLATVRSELARIEKADNLEEQLATLNIQLADLEEMARMSALREAEYETRLASLQAVSGLSEENERLRGELSAARETGKSLQQELVSARKRVSETQAELRSEQATLAATIVTPALSVEEKLDLALRDASLSEAQEKVLRDAANYCRNFGGQYGLVSFGPNRHAVSCSFRDQSVLLDESSFQPGFAAPNVPVPPGFPERGRLICSTAAGTLVAQSRPGFGPFLCRLEDGKGIVIEDFAGY